MKVLCSTVTKSFTIKKSKFLCFGYFVNSKEEIKKIIDDIKKEYSDASHICYAYILDDKTFYYTDAGEPSGTAGKPIYGALISNSLNYTLFIVIRYFGGIKFGPGPLRSTFKDVTMQTLSQAKTSNAIICDTIQIQLPYSQIKLFDNIFKSFNYEKRYQKDFVVINIYGKQNEIVDLLNKLNIKPSLIQNEQIRCYKLK